jgi:predicted MPP superfamily phosphohydrolase
MPLRRRRRPILFRTVVILLALSEVEVLWTARSLASVVHSSALAFFLTHILPVAAIAFLIAPFFHLPRLRAKRDSLPDWMLYGYVTPAYLFLLACFAHAFFGTVFEGVRGSLGLGLPPLSVRLFDLALPFVMAGYGGVLGHLWTRVERGMLALPGLGPELVGLRIVQLSDLHAGGMVGARRLNRIARQVARLQPDLVVVTGDIVNAMPHEAELVAPILAALPAKLGVWACLGNHDHFVDGDAVAEILERAGVRVLRNRGEVIRRGDSAFWLAGVDDTWTHRDDLDAALAAKPEGLPVLLLAHDPALWPAAAARRVDVTLSGHTHGGQFGLVQLHPALSLARLMTPFTAGRFQKGGSVLHVSRGTANTLPIRLGAPTEVGLFELVDRALRAPEPHAE